MLAIADEDVGGARIRRSFTKDGEVLKRGDRDLTAEEFLSINLPNRIALVDANFLEPYPKNPGAVRGEKFLIRIGKDEFNVIEGRMLNADPLTKEQADQLMRS